jgi:hypothetical protein
MASDEVPIFPGLLSGIDELILEYLCRADSMFSDKFVDGDPS